VKDDRLYLSHIQEGIARILSYTASGESAFRSDIKTQDAVIRNLQVLGEAVKNVSMETRAAVGHRDGVAPAEVIAREERFRVDGTARPRSRPTKRPTSSSA